MDPIEKLLSELAPAQSSGRLDQAVGEILRKADRRARLRHVGRLAGGMSAVLSLGVFAGYYLGADAAQPIPPPNITYIVPMESSAFHSLVEGSSRMPAVPSMQFAPILVDDALTTESGA